MLQAGDETVCVSCLMSTECPEDWHLVKEDLGKTVAEWTKDDMDKSERLFRRVKPDSELGKLRKLLAMVEEKHQYDCNCGADRKPGDPWCPVGLALGELLGWGDRGFVP